MTEGPSEFFDCAVKKPGLSIKATSGYLSVLSYKIRSSW